MEKQLALPDAATLPCKAPTPGAPAATSPAAGACVQQCGRAAACNPLCVDALQRRLGPDRSPAVLQQQHLFTVYVHARPTLKDYAEGTVFGGRLIPDRIVSLLLPGCLPPLAGGWASLTAAWRRCQLANRQLCCMIYRAHR